MKLIIDYYQFLDKYREKLSLICQDLPFVEILVIYSLSIGKETRNEIVGFLQKDRSQIHRVLKKLVEKKLILKTENIYVLTPSGLSLSKELSKHNKIICNILGKGIDLRALHQTIKTAKKLLNQ